MWVVVACVFGGIHPFHLNLTLQCLELHYFLRNFFIISVRVCRNMPCLIPDTDHLCLIFPLIILLEVCQFFDLSKQLGFIIDFVFLFPIPLISAFFFFFFSFLLFAFSLFCSSFSRFLRQELRWLIWDSSSFLFFLNILLKYGWLTTFQVHSRMIQLYMYMYIIFEVTFHYRLLQDIDYSSLGYTVIFSNVNVSMHTFL